MRRFTRFVSGVPMWCGPGVAHMAFHRRGQLGKLQAAAQSLRTTRGGGYALGWEGDAFVISFKSEVGGC